MLNNNYYKLINVIRILYEPYKLVLTLKSLYFLVLYILKLIVE